MNPHPATPLDRASAGGGEAATLSARSPIDGALLGHLQAADDAAVDRALDGAVEAFVAWRRVPAPVRGRLVRRIGELVRDRKRELASVITLEVGKTIAEAEGEVQEWIDICEFAVGLSRQLHGLTIVSERPDHRMMEQWHPLGPVAVITAFNFPMAVWAWNAMLALVCGDPVVWKPSEKAGLCADAVARLVAGAIEAEGAPPAICQVLHGGAAVGQRLAADRRIPLVSATGSTAMGREVAATVGRRLGRSLLELGGNNAMIVTQSARLELVVRAATFAAVGTSGQRCTSLRRLLVHASLVDDLVTRLTAAFASLRIGDPRDPAVLVGPLIDARAVEAMQAALDEAVAQGGVVVAGGGRPDCVPDGGHYVRPAIVRIGHGAPVVARETFAPILYVQSWESLDEAIALQNGVSHGLSSAIFTEQLREAERFVAVDGSDCGIANVNIGTSGAEIGGAFGGEKDSGGGRESGSDCWKSYMRRATNTINHGSALPLAQGVRFDV
jgi:aldehyde dehydrogenase (NAD+)